MKNSQHVSTLVLFDHVCNYFLKFHFLILRMIVSLCQITMARMWRLSLVAAVTLSSAAALPKPQEHGQPEHAMELGNIDNVGVTLR